MEKAVLNRYVGGATKELITIAKSGEQTALLDRHYQMQQTINKHKNKIAPSEGILSSDRSKRREAIAEMTANKQPFNEASDQLSNAYITINSALTEAKIVENHAEAQKQIYEIWQEVYYKVLKRLGR
ncbi:MAG: hypothetical protein ABIH83_01825 [Candidatus Micrarchaeota archaeon]